MNSPAPPLSIRLSPGSFLVCLRSATYVFGRLKRREYRETDEDEFHYESPAWAAERVRQFATIKDLLTADTPGTS